MRCALRSGAMAGRSPRCAPMISPPSRSGRSLSAIPRSTGRRSTRSCSAAPIRRAKTTATWRAWRCCSRACPIPSLASPSIGFAPPASMPSAMPRAPFVMGKAQEAFPRGAEIHDTTLGWRFVNPVIKAQYGIDSMAETGENVAEEYQVSRADQDAFALRSQQRAGKAMAAGYFAEEIVPVEVAGKGGPVAVEKDEHPRPETTLEGLGKLKPIVRNG